MYLSQEIVSGKVKELYSDSGRNRVMGMFIKGKEKEKEKELMIIKEKEKEKQPSKKQATVVDSGEEEMGRDSAQQQSLMEEIISVERERKDLLASLTPTFSLWKEIGPSPQRSLLLFLGTTMRIHLQTTST